ncbi:MAG: hypothetical protein ABJZ55_17825 [Fuerstiella sp.]
MKPLIHNSAASTVSSRDAHSFVEPSAHSFSLAARLKVRLSENRFLRNVVSNAGGNALNSVLQLGLLLLLSRMLGAASYAAWLTAGSIIAIGECASDFGTRLWAVRAFAGTADAASVLRQCLWNKLFYTFCAFAVLSLLPLNTLAVGELLMALAVAATQPSTDPLLWFLRGKDRLDVEAGLVLSARLCMVGLVAAASWFQLSLEWLLSGWLLCNVTRMTMTWRLSICQPLWKMSTAGAVGRGFKKISNGVTDVFPIGVSLVLAPFFTQAALLTLSIQGTDHDVNVFGTAFKLVIAAGFVGTSVVVSSFARLSEAVQDGDVVRIQKIVNQKCGLLIRVMLPICVLGIVLAVPVSNLLLTPELSAVGTAMILLIPGLYLSCVNMAGKYTLNACGRNWLDVVSMLIGFVAFGSIYFLLTGIGKSSLMDGVWLAATCWTGSELVVLICRMYFVAFRPVTERRDQSTIQANGVTLPVVSILLAVATLVAVSALVFVWHQGWNSNTFWTETL